MFHEGLVILKEAAGPETAYILKRYEPNPLVPDPSDPTGRRRIRAMPKNLPQNEFFGSLVLEDFANVAAARPLPSLDKLSPGLRAKVAAAPGEFYLVPVVSKANMPSVRFSEPQKAHARAFVGAGFSKKTDRHAGNVGYAGPEGRTPVEFDHDKTFFIDFFNKIDPQFVPASFLVLLAREAVMRHVRDEIIRGVSSSQNQKLLNRIRETDDPAILNQRGIDWLVAEMRQILQNYGLGRGFLEAEMILDEQGNLNPEVAQAIKDFKTISDADFMKWAREAGLQGDRLQAKVAFAMRERDALGRNMNDLLEFLTGRNFGLSTLDQPLAPGAQSLGQPEQGAEEFLAAEGRDLKAVLTVAIRLTDGVLYVKGSPEVLERLMRKLGLFKEEGSHGRPVELFASRFNKGTLDKAILKYLGKGGSRETSRSNIPFILFDKVLEMDSDQVNEAVREFSGQLEQGDFVGVVWKDSIPGFFEGLNRVKQAKDLEVRAVREELAAATLPRWTKGSKHTVVVSTVDENMLELHVNGQKVALNLHELKQAGINPIKVLSLLRQIGDDTEAYGKLGFMMDKEKGFWVVGAGFTEVIRRLDAEHAASLATGRAA